MRVGVQGALPELFQEIQAVFPLEDIFTPTELQSEFNGSWPSIDRLSAGGKKVLFVTGYDYGPVIDALMFSKCGSLLFWGHPSGACAALALQQTPPAESGGTDPKP